MGSYNKTLSRQMHGKSLAEMYFTIGVDDCSLAELKKAALTDFNRELGTNYKIRHLDNWLAGRKPIPQRIRSAMRRAILLYVLGEQTTEDLKGLL